jgi:hypothetical protein
MLQHIPLSSSNVESCAYDDRRQILEISFKGGRVYHYLDVDPGTFLGLISASSPGAYVNSSIAYNFNYQFGPAPETTLLEDALEELPQIAEAVAMPEEAVARGVMSRFVGALRRMLPF